MELVTYKLIKSQRYGLVCERKKRCKLERADAGVGGGAAVAVDGVFWAVYDAFVVCNLFRVHGEDGEKKNGVQVRSAAAAGGGRCGGEPDDSPP